MIKTGFKIFGWILLAIIVFGIFGIIFRAVLFPFFVADKVSDAAHGVVEKTINADNVLHNYEKFKDLYNGAKQQVANIESTEQSITNLKETYGADVANWPKDVRDKLSFLNDTLGAYKQQYQRTASDYNSDSSKLNRNLFKDRNLPSELPLDYTLLQ